MNKSIILMSGGLDSLVSLALKKEELNIVKALTFDYGQKSVNKEIEASKNICSYYNIELEIINLKFLKDITKTALVSDSSIPENVNLNNNFNSAKAVWVPNRNGLFLNIAACYADSFEYNYIVIGANKEEAGTFPDNTKQFIDRINCTFEYSTLRKPQVVAPLINYNKNDIVMLALKNSVPLELVMSCYSNCEKHCGTCESCLRLKNALAQNKDVYYTRILFG